MLLSGMLYSILLTLVLYTASVCGDCCEGVQVLQSCVGGKNFQDNAMVHYQCSDGIGTQKAGVCKQCSILHHCSLPLSCVIVLFAFSFDCSKGTSLTGGAIALIVIVPLVIITASVVGCYFCCYRRRRRSTWPVPGIVYHVHRATHYMWLNNPFPKVIPHNSSNQCYSKVNTHLKMPNRCL